MEYANTFEKRATGSTVGNGNRERERDEKLRGWTTQPWKTWARQEKKKLPRLSCGVCIW